MATPDFMFTQGSKQILLAHKHRLPHGLGDLAEFGGADDKGRHGVEQFAEGAQPDALFH